MKFIRFGIAVTATFALLASAAWACSSCIRHITPEAEFDRQGWDQSPHVFVGLVVSTRLARDRRSVEYTVTAEERLKGNPRMVTRIFSSLSIGAWSKEFDEEALAEVSCGHFSIASGDRVLVFSGPNGVAGIGACSWSRVVEGGANPGGEAVQRTLRRLRDWSRSAGERAK